MPDLAIKRAYDPPAPDDGARVLVDRLWPRGLTHEALALDLWLKDIAPSDELRREFHHDPTRWPEFQRRYAAELAGNPAVQTLCDLMAKGRVTLIYAAKDQVHNNAAALRDWFRGH
ncbi:MAG: DUF488 domain-containing protein [Paracoccus sp. (in: a-proteobacteria)]|uniref:DUF488 domain-containing protein n=1 Tax=Paracoccus sp. TaxID=267 RepID=UPI0026E0A7AE|nr:DUF488 domain-containing protein [Paracoccus sp. (in: a-proteobacteria)]MDO5613126.1 DUF488 domain-containing protein [Paracoccus sp. (in: a-proteobacteria)]